MRVRVVKKCLLTKTKGGEMKDICVRESYTDSKGTEVTSWNKIGILIEKGEKQYVKLYHMPGTLCSVFEQKKKYDTKEQSIDLDQAPF